MGLIVRQWRSSAVVVAMLCVVATVCAAPALADNSRFNNGVISNVYTIQRQAGCATSVRPNLKLQLAAEWHADDVLNNRDLDGDTGSDGSSAAVRAHNAGYQGAVAETVAINPALAISGIELLNQWYYRSDYYGIMSDCHNVDIGVWSVNSLDRTVVVAVYGHGD